MHGGIQKLLENSVLLHVGPTALSPLFMSAGWRAAGDRSNYCLVHLFHRIKEPSFHLLMNDDGWMVVVFYY
jgi:hypothetical protein